MNTLINNQNNNIFSINRKQTTFFKSFLFRVFICFFLIFASFLIIEKANAGFFKYSDFYKVDATIKNEKEIEASEAIEIIFNQPVIFLNSDNIKFNPKVDFDFKLSSGRTLILTGKYFSPETKYEINLKNVRGLSGLILENKKFVFYTKSQGTDSRIINNQTENLFSLFQLSRDKYLVPEISKPKKDIEIISQFKEGKYIDVSISNQVMTIFEDGVKINNFLISSGKNGMPTPLGTFYVRKKESNHWSFTYGLWMPYSMNFYGAYYIHELPYWPSGYREGEDHLGIRVSHGCIRLGVGPAEYVFNWAEVGIPVYIHY